MLIAIDGRGGSGKTTLSERLRLSLPDTTVVHLDDFASPNTDRQRLLEQVIFPLNENKPARYQRFDWKQKALAEWHDIQPGGTVIIEGVSTLHDVLYKHFDVKIWIECSPQVGLERGLKRDELLYGLDTRNEWLQAWMLEEQSYVDAHKPHERADYIIDAVIS